MATSPVNIPKTPLPRSLDVSVSISRPSTEIATDMTLMCVLSREVNLPPDNGRVAYFSTFAALETIASAGSTLWYAGNAFFSQEPRPQTFAVGRIFTDPVPAAVVSGTPQLDALRAVGDGSFVITMTDGKQMQTETVTGLDFSKIASLEDVVGVLADKLPVWAVPSTRDGSIVIETGLTGNGVSIETLTPAESGTDVLPLLALTADTLTHQYNGYTPEGLVSEAALVRDASKGNGRPIYGWALDRAYRDTEEQKEFAEWIEAQEPAIASLVTNEVGAYNTTNTTNIGYFARDKGFIRTSVFYHNNPQVYPDVSYLARALSVDYSVTDSTLTMKFKTLPGIETVPVTETMLSALTERRINTYTAIGNNSRTVREGVQSADTWYTDTVVNLDNYREELQVEVFNVFLRNKKVPYTTRGQQLLVSAAAKINAKYERNGTFADREVEDDENESGATVLPATQITPTPISNATTSERASRLAPPIQITAYEGGGMHKVNIGVDVYN